MYFCAKTNRWSYSLILRYVLLIAVILFISCRDEKKESHLDMLRKHQQINKGLEEVIEKLDGIVKVRVSIGQTKYFTSLGYENEVVMLVNMAKGKKLFYFKKAFINIIKNYKPIWETGRKSIYLKMTDMSTAQKIYQKVYRDRRL